MPLSVGLLSLLPIKGFNQSRQHQRQKLFHAANTVLCFHFPSAPQKVENRMFRATKIPPKEAAFSPRPQQLSSRQADTVSPTLLFPLQKPFQRLPSIIIWIFFPSPFSTRSAFATFQLYQSRLLRLATQHCLVGLCSSTADAATPFTSVRISFKGSC